MNDDEFPTGSDREVDRSAREPMDATDTALLGEVAQMLDESDPVPADLVQRIQFSLALNEVFAEVASITRMPADTLAVRGDPVAGTRTETLTFSAEVLTAMVTVSRAAPGRVRVDGWIAPPSQQRVQLRMQQGSHEVTADEAGRFVFEGLPEGFAQLSFHPGDDAADEADGVVVTPVFQL